MKNLTPEAIETLEKDGMEVHPVHRGEGGHVVISHGR